MVVAKSDIFLSPNLWTVLDNASSSALAVAFSYVTTMEGYLEVVQYRLVTWAPFTMDLPKVAYRTNFVPLSGNIAVDVCQV